MNGGDKLMAGGEQHTSLQRVEGGDGTDGIFKGDDDGATERIDHGQTSGEGGSDDGREDDAGEDAEHVDHEYDSGEDGSTDDGRDDDVELDGENSSYDGDLRSR